MKKKGLVLAIVIAMLTSIIPSFAFATENNSSDEAITKAKEKYLQAEAEYKQGPVKFLEARLCDEHKNTHSKAGYEKALGDENKLASYGHQDVYNCYRAFCDDKNKEKLESNWFTFDNLRLQATWLNELNELRKNDDNFRGKEYQSSVYLNPELIMESMMSSMIGYYQRSVFHKTSHLLGRDHSVPAIPSTGENLAWSYKNPFDGWYHAEKKLYDEGERKTDEIGHYKFIMAKCGEKSFAGFGAYGDVDDYKLNGWGCNAMRMHDTDDLNPNETEPIYTADEWLKEVNAYEKELKNKVNQAKKEWEEAKYTPEVTVTPADLTYNKESQNLVSESKTSGGKLLYCMDKKEYVYNQDTGKGEWKTHKTDWSEKIPTATDAGEYKIYYKVEGTDYYRDRAEQELTVTIKKATPVVNVEFKNPEALVVDYDAQGKDIKLVTKAETTGGTLMFSSSKDDKWSNALPTESKPGKYTISYRVDGDKNYSDVPAKTHEVEIKKCQPRVSVSFKKGLVYNGNNQDLVEKAIGNGNSIYYKVDDGKWTLEATAMDAGEHKVRYKTEELPYVLPMESKEYTVSIEKAEPKCDAEFADDTITYDNKVYLVHKTGNDKSPALMAGINYEQKIEYKVNNGEWTTECPKATKAGDYTVSYRVPSSKNFKEIPEKTKTIHVKAAAPTFDIKFAEDQEYNGKPITIFNLLVCENGTFKYKINDGEWSSNSYKKVQKPGTYKITYKVEGNEGYSDIPEKEHTVVIREKAKPKAQISESYSKEETCTYSPDGVDLFVGKSSSYGCKIVYSVNGGEWTETIPEAKNAGTYEVRCKII